MQGLLVLNFAQGGCRIILKHITIDRRCTLNDHLPSQYALTRLPGTSRLTQQLPEMC
jgi:hypothetical protein